MNKLYFVLIILLMSCVAKDLNPMKLDPSMKSDYQQLKDKILPQASKKNENISSLSQESEMPNIVPIIASPPEAIIGKDKLVSISINDDVPLKEVFVELSRLADVDISIDPTIVGGVILRARNKPFSEVIERICELSNLRYSNDKGSLRIENDNPFLVNYNLDFLNIIRTNSGGTNLSTVLSGSTSGAGSTTAISSKYDNDLWNSIELDIKKILSTNAKNSTGSSNSTKFSDVSGGGYITSNKQAGLVNIFATNKQHKMIKSYLEKVRESTSAQVLIEAKIVEIALNDAYQSGVNWNVFRDLATVATLGSKPSTLTINNNTIDPQLTLDNQSSPFKLSKISSLTSAVQLSEAFGSARTLSSPRIHAINNQQAVLSFVDNQVYFSVSIQSNPTTTTGANGVTTTTNDLTLNSTSHTVPIGVMLTLQPAINLDTEEITMNIRPTITTTSSSVKDPAVSYIAAQNGLSNIINSSVPVISVKELDSILKIKSGEIMVIGGMMQDSSSNTEVGVPVLMSVPLFGNLFKNSTKINQTTQIVIFIQATIIPSDKIQKRDRDVYNNFAIDKEVSI